MCGQDGARCACARRTRHLPSLQAPNSGTPRCCAALRLRQVAPLPRSLSPLDENAPPPKPPTPSVDSDSVASIESQRKLCMSFHLVRLLWQVGAQTETELKEKKLRVEDALNATKVGAPHRRRSTAAVPCSALPCATTACGVFCAGHRPAACVWRACLHVGGGVPSPPLPRFRHSTFLLLRAGRCGGGHCHRRRLHPAAPVPHGRRLQGHPHRRGAEGAWGWGGRGVWGVSACPSVRAAPPQCLLLLPCPAGHQAAADLTSPPPKRFVPLFVLRRSAPTLSSARCPTA